MQNLLFGVRENGKREIPALRCLGRCLGLAPKRQHRSKVGSRELSNQRQIKATDINDDPCNKSMHLLVRSSSPSGNHFCNQISFYHVFGESELASINNNFTTEHRPEHKTDV